MNISNHVDIFTAYLSRMSGDRMKRLESAVRNISHAGMNGNTSSQLEAFNLLKTEVMNSLSSLSCEDIERLTKICAKNT